jgi:hypothetical protein
MLLNIIIGFIIPWLFASFIYFRDRKILFIIAPFASVLSYAINSTAMFLGLWKLYPFEFGKDSTIPFDLGLYPVLASYLIYLANKSRINNWAVITIITTFTTLLEWLGLLLGRVVYGNGWNLAFTFFSYLIPYLLIYWFYLGLKKAKVFD